MSFENIPSIRIQLFLIIKCDEYKFIFFFFFDCMADIKIMKDNWHLLLKIQFYEIVRHLG